MKLKVVKAGECGDAVRLYNGDCLDILKNLFLITVLIWLLLIHPM